MDWGTFVLDLLKIAAGGLLGGGPVAYVEWRRLRRQQREWDLTDKQVELRLIDAEFTEQRYSVQNASSKEEELRLYKAKLDGKLRNWQYLVKVSVVNTTSAELLALSADTRSRSSISRELN
jgi:hypothetical protein